MKRQYRNPSIPARIAAWIAALVLTFTMTLTLIGWTCVSILASEDLYVRTATDEDVVTGQMERVSSIIRELSVRYGFSADHVIAALDREEFAGADREMAQWWSRITTEGTMDPEVPAWSADSLLPVIEESLDPGMIPEDQYSTEVAQEIVFALEKEATRTMMPIRRTLITLGFRYLDKRIDMPGAIRLINSMPLAGLAVCILLAGLIALFSGRRIRTSLKYYGGAFGGAGLSAIFALIMIRHLGIIDMIRKSSESLADQIHIMTRSAETGYIIGIAVLLLVYTLKKADSITDGGAHEEKEGRSPDPV